ncbi:MAG: CvpA family protein [Pirellulales bacterium]|nr:CvpA family protein [Pirellulales bacterium]
MSFLFPLLLVVIFVAVAISLYTEGLWGNALRLINVVTAALLATNFYEPLANWLQSMDALKSYRYLLDFLCIWLLFGIAMGVLRGATDYISKVKVRFLQIVDRVGSGILSCCVAAVMVSFITMSLHTAPLAEEFMWGGFQSEKPMMMGLAPDIKWLRFTQMVSGGAFARSPKKPMDRQQFISRYKQRRKEIENHVTTTGKIRTN